MASSSETDSDSSADLERAESVFLDALGRGQGLDALVDEHPGLARALRRVAADWAWLEGMRESGDLPHDLEGQVRAPEERYTRAEVLGRGGMGAVYRARDEHLGRDVAFKRSFARQARGAGDAAAPRNRAVYRFLDEARCMGRLDHPGILPVHDVGIDRDGYAWFTMALVAGEDLAARLGPKGRVRDDELVPTVRILERVAETMAYAHGRGVLHRDLKPSNVMLGTFGQVHVTDWGLARDLAAAPRSTDQGGTPGSVAGGGELRTADGAVVGTPAYMAPEQARAGGEIDARADVYAVGAMLYHVLAGMAPYAQSGGSRGTTSCLDALRAGPPVPLRSQRDDLPGELVAIAERAMERDPSRRYGSMRELARDLRAWLEGRPVRAAAPGPLTHLAKWIRRNRPTAAALLALFLTVLGWGLLYAWAQRSHRLALEDANDRLREETALALAASERAARSADAGRIKLAEDAFERGDRSGGEGLLAAVPPERRDWLWGFVARRSNDALVEIDVGEGRPLGAIAVGPRSGRIAVAVREAFDALHFLDAAGVRSQGAGVAVKGCATWMEFDAEESFLALRLDDRRVGLLDCATGRLRTVDPEHHGRVAAWGPRGTSLYFDRATPGGRRLFRLADPRHVDAEPELVADVPPFVDLAASPVSGALVGVEFDGTVSIVAADTGAVLARHAPPVPMRDPRISVSADGGRVAVIGFGGVSWVFETLTGENLQVRRTGELYGRTSVFADGGAALVRLLGSAVLVEPVIGPGVPTVRVGCGATAAGVARDRFSGRLWVTSEDGFLRAFRAGPFAPGSTQAEGRADRREWGDRVATTLVWDPPRGRFVVAGGCGRLLSFDPDTGTFARGFETFEGPTGAVRHLHRIPGKVAGEDLLIGLRMRSSADAVVWDLGTGRHVGGFPIGDRRWRSVSVPPDGSILAVCDEKRVVDVFALPAGRRLLRLQVAMPDPTATSVVALDADRILLCDEAGGLTAIDVGTGARGAHAQLPSSTATVGAVAPDGLRVAVGTASGDVLVLRTDDLSTAGVLRRHRAPLGHVQWIDGGQRLLTASMDGDYSFWEVETGRHLFDGRGVCDRAYAFAFVPARSLLLVAGNRGLEVDGAERPRELLPSDGLVPGVERLFEEHVTLDRVLGVLGNGSTDTVDATRHRRNAAFLLAPAAHEHVRRARACIGEGRLDRAALHLDEAVRGNGESSEIRALAALLGSRR